MTNLDRYIKWGFWGLWLAIAAVGSYYIVANAAWVLGDDSQVIIYTGWDHPIFGFFVAPECGRFFPLDYTVYDALLPFFDGRISPFAHYMVHVFWYIIFLGFFTAISFHLLKGQKPIWKYGITMMLLIALVGRTLLHFMQCWTGIWTIIAFIPIFVYGYIRFFDTKKWGYAVLALVAINYVLYYYETMFTIPVTIGACSLLFAYKKQDQQERIFNYLLIASSLLFLLLYAILVFPRIEQAYSHYTEDSLLANAIKMLFAQKIMWIVIIALIVRLVQFIKKKADYTIYDGLLLASCAYCCGAAVLHLNYVLYYTPAVILALPALLYFSVRYMKQYVILALFAGLAVFYGVKIPRDIKQTQKDRVETYENICKFNELVNSGINVYYYMPTNNTLNEGDLDLRSTRAFYLEKNAGWYQNNENFKVIRVGDESNFASGLWVMDSKDESIFKKQCAEYSMPDIHFENYQLYMVP